MTGLSGEKWTITAGKNEATVVEVGAGLQSYTYDGKDVTCRYGDDELPPKGCGTTLVPWPNRIRDGRYTFDGVTQQLALTEPDKGNAIHGLGRWARWSLVRRMDTEVTLGLDIVPQKGYPFQVRVEITYRVQESIGLIVTIMAWNNGTTRAPFGAGSHPYLSTRGGTLDMVGLTVPAYETFDVDEQQIPVGKRRRLTKEENLRRGDPLFDRRFDRGFTKLKFEDGWVDILLTSSKGAQGRMWVEDAFRYLQVYTVDEVTPGQPGVAVEPMSCAPDAFNSGKGLVVLEPGEMWTGRWGIAPPLNGL